MDINVRSKDEKNGNRKEGRNEIEYGYGNIP
jgi:hypothetical protein